MVQMYLSWQDFSDNVKEISVIIRWINLWLCIFVEYFYRGNKCIYERHMQEVFVSSLYVELNE